MGALLDSLMLSYAVAFNLSAGSIAGLRLQRFLSDNWRTIGAEWQWVLAGAAAGAAIGWATF